MIRYILFFFTGLITLSLHAQQEDELVRNVMNDMTLNGAHEGIPYYAVNNTGTADIKGSFYLEDDWEEGYVMTHDDEVFRIIGRYNLLTDEMQLRTSQGETRALFPNKMKGMSLNDRIFIPYPYYEKGKKPRVSYFELLVDGELPLYRHYHAALKNSDPHPVLGSTGDSKKVEIVETLYYKRNGENLTELPKKKADILKALSFKRNNLISFIRENRLSFRKVDDIMKMFEYHNQLRSSDDE